MHPGQQQHLFTLPQDSKRRTVVRPVREAVDKLDTWELAWDRLRTLGCRGPLCATSFTGFGAHMSQGSTFKAEMTSALCPSDTYTLQTAIHRCWVTQHGKRCQELATHSDRLQTIYRPVDPQADLMTLRWLHACDRFLCCCCRCAHTESKAFTWRQKLADRNSRCSRGYGKHFWRASAPVCWRIWTSSPS